VRSLEIIDTRQKMSIDVSFKLSSEIKRVIMVSKMKQEVIKLQKLDDSLLDDSLIDEDHEQSLIETLLVIYINQI